MKKVANPPAGLPDDLLALWKAHAGRQSPARRETLAEALLCLTRLRAVRGAIDADGLTLTSKRSGLQRAHPLLAHETALRKQFLDLWHRAGLQSSGGPQVGGLTDADMVLLGAIAPKN